jgi:hypothetical protein
MKQRKNGRNIGEVFTNKTVVQYLLDEVNYVAEVNLMNIKILEPSSGTGIFATEIIDRLFSSSQHFDFPFINALLLNVRFIELDTSVFNELQKKIDECIFKLTAN